MSGCGVRQAEDQLLRFRGTCECGVPLRWVGVCCMFASEDQAGPAGK